MTIALSASPLAAGDAGSGMPVRLVTSRLPVRVLEVASDVATGAASVAFNNGAAATWACVIELGGIDISDRVTGDVVVEGEENAARVCDFSFILEPGVIDVVSLNGKDVTISVGQAIGGSVVGAVRIFTGCVDTPSIDTSTSTVALRCSDNRQSIIAGFQKSQIAEILPGSYFSPAVFSAAVSAWAEFNARLSTIPASVEINAFGSIRVTPWAAKEVPDIIFDDDIVLDGGISPELASRSELINRVDIEFGYRYPRVKSEGYLVSYDYLLDTPGFADWVRDGNAFLTRAQVVRAIESAGGTVEEVVWSALPSHAVMLPSGDAAWIPNPATDNLLCLGFNALVSFDYAQEQDEKHVITVSCDQSIGAIGVVRESLNGAMQGRYVDLVAAETAIKSFRQSTSDKPPRDVAPIGRGLTIAQSVTLTDDTNRDAAVAAMQCLIAIAKAKIQQAHRRSSAQFKVPFWPALDIDKTVRASARGVTARGKVRRFVHRLSPATGSAVTECTLALSLAAGVGATQFDDSMPVPGAVQDGATSTLGLPIVIWNGLLGQDQNITITFPGVEDAERQLAVTKIETQVSVGVAEDLLEIVI